MADTIGTKRDYRAEARPVFEEMGRLLEHIRRDETASEHERRYGARTR